MLWRDIKNIAIRSLNWTPSGKRMPRRFKETWRSTIETEMKEANYDWNNITISINYRIGRFLIEPEELISA